MDIFFAGDLSTHTYYLFDLPQELLSQVEAGTVLKIKGAPEEEAVICNENTTYAIKSYETSNWQVVFSGNSGICKTQNVYKFEKMIPPFHELQALLETSQFSLVDDIEAQKFTLEELERRLRISDQQLRDQLDAVNAFILDGYVTILDKNFEIEAMKVVLKFHTEVGGKSQDSKRLIAILRNHYLTDTPDEPFRAVCKSCGFIDEAGTWYPDIQKIQQLLAEDLFLVRSDYLLPEFEEGIRRLVELVSPRLVEEVDLQKALQGMAITYNAFGERAIKHLPSNSLSYDLLPRLKSMFSAKPKWTQEEIAIYLNPIILSPISSILMSYTRRISEGNEVLFVQKFQVIYDNKNMRRRKLKKEAIELDRTLNVKYFNLLQDDELTINKFRSISPGNTGLNSPSSPMRHRRLGTRASQRSRLNSSTCAHRNRIASLTRPITPAEEQFRSISRAWNIQRKLSKKMGNRVSMYKRFLREQKRKELADSVQIDFEQPSLYEMLERQEKVRNISRKIVRV